ncbi:hypothetical protein BS17DRAFT_808373 [Gyrodon lividus]|nr:hypothetical protein BS17DRAFT_808373 [Gyrodon lividus]
MASRIPESTSVCLSNLPERCETEYLARMLDQVFGACGDENWEVILVSVYLPCPRCDMASTSERIMIISAHADMWFQIGHMYEQQKDHVRAKDAYERVVADNPGHAKVLQQLGWLYHQDGSCFQNQELAIQCLMKNLEADPSMRKAGTFSVVPIWQAKSTTGPTKPISRLFFFDLGSLYESCDNLISDVTDAYARASELDPSNYVISQRLQLLKNAQATGSSCDIAMRGPAGTNILLHHPVPQQQVPTEELRSSAAHGPDQYREYFSRPLRVPSTSVSHPPPRTRSPGPSFQLYHPSSRQPVGPAQSASQCSPPSYPREPLHQGERDMAWERRGPPPEATDIFLVAFAQAPSYSCLVFEVYSYANWSKVHK